jgi:hypothetical protein
MLTARPAEVADVRWAFWRTSPRETPQRPLADDVGLPTRPRPPAAPRGDGRDDDSSRAGTGVTGPVGGPRPSAEASAADTDQPLTASAPDVDTTDLDTTDLAAAGPALAALVQTSAAHQPAPPSTSDDRTLAVVATAALAARLPALSGADGAIVDEPEDQLLHTYAELLATRAAAGAPLRDERDDLLAVAHVAAAAAVIGAADELGLLLLAGVPADRQLRAAVLLLAQTTADGGAPPSSLTAEVRALFGAPG